MRDETLKDWAEEYMHYSQAQIEIFTQLLKDQTKAAMEGSDDFDATLFAVLVLIDVMVPISIYCQRRSTEELGILE